MTSNPIYQFDNIMSMYGNTMHVNPAFFRRRASPSQQLCRAAFVLPRGSPIPAEPGEGQWEDQSTPRRLQLFHRREGTAVVWFMPNLGGTWVPESCWAPTFSLSVPDSSSVSFSSLILPSLLPPFFFSWHLWHVLPKTPSDTVLSFERPQGLAHLLLRGSVPQLGGLGWGGGADRCLRWEKHG